jgi:predicted nucleic acid-binding protein
MSEPSTPQFLDANILIYAHDRSARSKQIRARELVRELWQSGEGCLSIQVLQEFYVNVTQKVSKPLSGEVAAQIIADLSLWPTHRPGPQDILDAIHLQSRYEITFGDAMIIASPIQMGCETLWSEDLNPGQVYGQVTVRNPF